MDDLSYKIWLLQEAKQIVDFQFLDKHPTQYWQSGVYWDMIKAQADELDKWIYPDTSPDKMSYPDEETETAKYTLKPWFGNQVALYKDGIMVRLSDEIEFVDGEPQI